MPSKRERKLISKNRSAHHEYFIDETFECGIELSGTEVKSIRERACQITDTFALIRGGECWLVGLHIHPYSHGGVWNRDPDRRRRLLLHRKEIDFLDGKLRNRGYALVPLELYFNTDGRVKLLLGLGRGKKLYDKREDMAKRDVQREIDRALKERNRYGLISGRAGMFIHHCCRTPGLLLASCGGIVPVCWVSRLKQGLFHRNCVWLIFLTVLTHMSHCGYIRLQGSIPS